MRSKIFYTYNGVDYADYDLYCETEERENLVYVFDKAKWLYPKPSTFVPQKGMKVYVVPGCPRAIADIRKDYVIKRSPDDADFIVTSVRSDAWSHYICLKDMIIIPSKKAIIATESYSYLKRLSIDDYARLVFNDYDVIKHQPDVVRIIRKSDEEVYLYAYKSEGIKYLLDEIRGLNKIPVIDYKHLPAYTTNTLEFDTIELVYKIGISDNTTNNQDNFLVQLQALNQTDWRNYTGTIHLLWWLLNRNHGCGSEKLSCISRLPKSVKELCSAMQKDAKYKSQDDMDMSRRLIESVTQLDLTNKPYWSMKAIQETLREHRVDTWIFYELYDNIVKIRPKCLE